MEVDNNVIEWPLRSGETRLTVLGAYYNETRRHNFYFPKAIALNYKLQSYLSPRRRQQSESGRARKDVNLSQGLCTMFGANKAANRVLWPRWWASFSAFMIAKHTVLVNILAQHESCILCLL